MTRAPRSCAGARASARHRWWRWRSPSRTCLRSSWAARSGGARSPDLARGSRAASEGGRRRVRLGHRARVSTEDTRARLVNPPRSRLALRRHPSASLPSAGAGRDRPHRRPKHRVGPRGGPWPEPGGSGSRGRGRAAGAKGGLPELTRGRGSGEGATWAGSRACCRSPGPTSGSWCRRRRASCGAGRRPGSCRRSRTWS